MSIRLAHPNLTESHDMYVIPERQSIRLRQNLKHISEISVTEDNHRYFQPFLETQSNLDIWKKGNHHHNFEAKQAFK